MPSVAKTKFSAIEKRGRRVENTGNWQSPGLCPNGTTGLSRGFQPRGTRHTLTWTQSKRSVLALHTSVQTETVRLHRSAFVSFALIRVGAYAPSLHPSVAGLSSDRPARLQRLRVSVIGYHQKQVNESRGTVQKLSLFSGRVPFLRCQIPLLSQKRDQSKCVYRNITKLRRGHYGSSDLK